MSWNTVRLGMSVFSRTTGPYRGISAPCYAPFHTVKLITFHFSPAEQKRAYLPMYVFEKTRVAC